MEGIKGFWATVIGKVLIIGIIGGVLLVTVLLGMVLFGGNPPESSSDPEQELASVIQTQKAAETASASQPTATVVPTETSLPTDTPVSDTTVPTGTPVATSTAGASTGTDPYLDNVNQGLQNYQSAYSDVNNYFQESTTDASKLLDNNWKRQAKMALNQLDDAANQLENLGDAPPEYEQLDGDLTSIASETDELVQNFGNGIDQFDPSAISNAAANLSKIASYVDSASQELDQFLNP
jgi:hypothetical protein